MNKIILTRIEKNLQKYIVYALINDYGEYQDFQLFTEKKSIINNIYVARVSKIIKGINAAFVSISPEQNCYLSLDDAVNPIYTNKKAKKAELCEGDEILVQVVKDAIKTKDPVVTTKLSIFGNNVILTNTNTKIGVSSKLNKDYSEQIKKSTNERFPNHKNEGYGLIIRTNAQNESEELVFADIENVVCCYSDIVKKASHQSLYSCIYHGKKDYLLQIKCHNINDITAIRTDYDDIYRELCEEYKDTEAYSKIEYYCDKAISLTTLYGVRKALDILTSRSVWLKCGGNIIIEQLETLTFIDVNSAKNISTDKKSILSTNLQAAAEIARQLRLRNISGMILIDFINMKSDKDNAILVDSLKSAIKEDNTVCTFIDKTKLGLVELTRKKTHKSLKQILCKTLDE